MLITNLLNAPGVARLLYAPVLFYGSVREYCFPPELRQVSGSPTHAELTFDVKSELLSLRL